MFDFLSPKDGPVVKGLEGQEIVYAKDQPQYIPLRTLVAKSRQRQTISRWTLTDEQRKAVAEGADIFLELSTFGDPLTPIRMAVSDTSGEAFVDWFKVCMLNQPLDVASEYDKRFSKACGFGLEAPTTEKADQAQSTEKISG